MHTEGSIYDVKELRLSKNGLKGTIHPSIGDLRTLTHFFANRNRLEGTIPDTIGNLQQLQVCLRKIILTVRLLDGFLAGS